MPDFFLLQIVANEHAVHPMISVTAANGPLLGRYLKASLKSTTRKHSREVGLPVLRSPNEAQ